MVYHRSPQPHEPLAVVFGDTPEEAEERALSSQPGVAGLVFSSFRFDNPEAVARGDWTA